MSLSWPGSTLLSEFLSGRTISGKSNNYPGFFPNQFRSHSMSGSFESMSFLEHSADNVSQSPKTAKHRRKIKARSHLIVVWEKEGKGREGKGREGKQREGKEKGNKGKGGKREEKIDLDFTFIYNPSFPFLRLKNWDLVFMESNKLIEVVASNNSFFWREVNSSILCENKIKQIHWKEHFVKIKRKNQETFAVLPQRDPASISRPNFPLIHRVALSLGFVHYFRWSPGDWRWCKLWSPGSNIYFFLFFFFLKRNKNQKWSLTSSIPTP